MIVMIKNEQFYLDFLKKNQPMLPDEELTEETLKIYDDARVYFQQNPNKACIPLFLNSFGERDGLGVYQLVEEVFYDFSIEDMKEHLINALSNKKGSIQYWCSRIASHFPCVEFIAHLEKLLYEGNFDIKCAVLDSLSLFDFHEARNAVSNFLKIEKDINIINHANELF